MRRGSPERGERLGRNEGWRAKGETERQRQRQRLQCLLFLFLSRAPSSFSSSSEAMLWDSGHPPTVHPLRHCRCLFACFSIINSTLLFSLFLPSFVRRSHSSSSWHSPSPSSCSQMLRGSQPIWLPKRTLIQSLFCSPRERKMSPFWTVSCSSLRAV